MSTLRAGKLRHLVSLQRPQITQNQTTGEMETAWVEFARVWTSIEPLSVRDFIAAGAEQSEVRARIQMRRRADIDASCRAVGLYGAHRGLAYTILGVMADKDSGLEHQTLAVTEGVRVAP
jgi:SPP1 family predicted phage head-tail adaptor